MPLFRAGCSSVQASPLQLYDPESERCTCIENARLFDIGSPEGLCLTNCGLKKFATFHLSRVELLLPSGTGVPGNIPERDETRCGIVSSIGRFVEIGSELPRTWNAFFRPSGALGDFAEAPTV